MKLIAKKVPVILVSIFMATNAYGGVALLRAVLNSPQGLRALARVIGVSPEKIAPLTIRERMSLYEIETTSSRARDVLRDLNMIKRTNIERIGDALTLAVLLGNVPSYRHEMIRLLYIPFSEFNPTKQAEIFSEEILTMMYEHPDKSVRYQFRQEFYDLINHLYKAENAEKLPLPGLPFLKEHISLFEGRIPKLALEETPLGRAIMSDSVYNFKEAYNNLLENGSLVTLLAQAYAKSASGKSLRNFAIEHMDPANLQSLRIAVGSNFMLAAELRRTIDRFNL